MKNLPSPLYVLPTCILYKNDASTIGTDKQFRNIKEREGIRGDESKTNFLSDPRDALSVLRGRAE